jgi:hypothetical protein
MTLHLQHSNVPPSRIVWTRTSRCLLMWPLVFSAVVMATSVGVAAAFDDAGGPLFWYCGCPAFALLYVFALGLPLALCGGRRWWFVRLIPVTIGAVVCAWSLQLVGSWAVPAVAIIALSIAAETAGRHHLWVAPIIRRWRERQRR